MQTQLSGQPLADFIRSRIALGGPVTVAQFMAWALYHPQYGYYMTGPNIGPRGDFTTSPEASPAFGKLLAKHVAEVDLLLDHPGRLDVVECGPGRGTLAAEMLEGLESRYPALYNRLTYWLVEISPALRETQQHLLTSRHGGVCRWVDDIKAIPRCITGTLIANEFMDAFPVHVIENQDGALLEQYVENFEPRGFRTFLGEPSDPTLLEFLRRYKLELQPGERIEVNLAMREWILHMGAKLERGVAALFDYGDTQPARYSEARRQGTLLGYCGGSVTSDITAHPGRQDLTALVDFTALIDDAHNAGLDDVGLTRQAHFLLGLGLGTSETPEAAGDSLDLINAVLEYRRGLQALVSMGGLGRFHVALLSNGVDPAHVRTGLSALQYADLV